MKEDRDASAEKPWWYPEIVDAAYLARLRSDYPENAHKSDEELRGDYDCEEKYGVTWDHIGDAYAEYEPLADAYLELEAEASRLRTECIRLREALAAVMKTVRDEAEASYQGHRNALDSEPSMQAAFKALKPAEWIAMPGDIPMSEAGASRHDMLVGPCGCGAWHSLSDWPKEVQALSPGAKP